jgi:hypothetical protein
MRTWEDEARYLRERIADLEDRIDRLINDAPDATPSAVFRIGTVPGTASKVFYPATMVTVTGDETEGTAVSTDDVGDTTIAGLGSKVPPVGTYVVGAMVADRWACLYNG